MELVLTAVAILAVMGVVFAVGLSVASRKFKVDADPRIEQIVEELPGANCGACGYGGCPAAAEAIVKGEVDVAACPVGGAEVAKRVADIMGVEVKEREREVAVVMCRGTKVKDRYDYDGVRDCRAAVIIQGGPKECEYGCIGFGTCVAVCQFEAIRMGDDGLPHVIEERCVACRACEKACPVDIIKVLPVSKMVHVLCSSHDKGKRVKDICGLGCIGCKKCEKVCKFEAIHVEDFLARIDYEKCVSCGKCVKECPTGVIKNFRPERKPKKQKKEAVAAEAEAAS